MAHRTAGVLLCTAPLRKPEKQEAIPASAGDLARDRAQRAVAARFVLRSVAQHFDDDLPIADPASEQRTRARQPAILRRSRAIDAHGTGIWSSHEFLRCADSQVAIIGDVGGPAARSLA